MKYIFTCIIIILAIGCAGKLIKFDQYSEVMSLKVEPDNSVFIGEDDNFTGVLFIGPIFTEENISPKKVKLIKNYGKYYLCAENFRNVWIIEPKNDGKSAGYKAIDATPGEKDDRYSGIGFSRYGSKENVNIKFKFNSKTVFIDRKGKIHEEYK